jgi:Ca2+-binding EF-hand superfamily protein
MTIDEILAYLKLYKLQPFDRNEIARLLREIFLLNDSEIDYVIKNFFRYDVSKNGYFLDTEMAKIFLELFFAEIILLRQHRLRKIAKWVERFINLEEFLELVRLSTEWMKIKHDKALLELIFKNIDTNHDGLISYKEYIAFIRRYLGGHTGDLEGGWWLPDPPVGDSAAEEEAFYGEIWSELRALYKHYVKGEFLTEQELELLVVQVLNESNKRDLEYVFWNMFRVDPNSDKKIEFEEFVSV